MRIDGRIAALAVVAIAGACIGGYIVVHQQNQKALPVEQVSTNSKADLWKDLNTGEQVAATDNPAQGTQSDFTLKEGNEPEIAAAEIAQRENDANAADVANIEPAAGEDTQSSASCKFDQFMNKPVNDKIRKKLENTGRPFRVLAPGSIYTQDYSADRINLNVDEKGIVLDIWCG